jgi:uncharacterized membrane protein
MYVGILLLLVGGIVAGLVGDHFARGWIWASLGLLVITTLAMYMLATPFYRRLREAVGAESGGRESTSPPLADSAAVSTLASSSRPIVLALVGFVAFAVILWLMLFKPF